MDMKENEDRMGRTLDALEHPGRFTREELEELLADRECVAACRDLLDCREALARRADEKRRGECDKRAEK